ncbi:hypothetical protein [Vibrio parahaemolyticus]|uniref:hypothetical protein n=1 Tax=Vibrio parahaemolyticus TaxID=670 RepID=UPI001172EC0A|nr:hypothetical protein [Vibrio parahaemolyticus]TOG36823.1 hypothetical protein CGJ03_05110 [Vibrio parahaemolyticus]HCM1552939.1 hypothetical protein [Vibrio parahaemolyticus]
MKRKYLALCVTNALIVSSLSFNTLEVRAEDNIEPSIYDKLLKVNGHVGLITEWKETVYYDASGNKTGKSTYTENSIFDTSLSFQEYPLDVFYAFKQATDDYQSKNGADNQKEEGLKHLLLLSTDHYLGNGFNVGASLNNEWYFADRVYSGPWVNGEYSKKEHLMEANLFTDYWNSRLGFGAYTYASYKMNNLVNDQQKGQEWGDYNIDGWAISTKPTKNFDSINIGVELYYGKDKTKSNNTGSYLQDFDEWFVEPSFSFTGDYGTFSIRHRYAQQTTTQNFGHDKYFTTVNKTTVGYNFSYDSWRLGGEVEFNKNENEADTSWSGGRVDNGHDELTRFMVYGQYAF